MIFTLSLLHLILLWLQTVTAGKSIFWQKTLKNQIFHQTKPNSIKEVLAYWRLTLNSDCSVHIEYIRHHVHQVVESPSQNMILRQDHQWQYEFVTQRRKECYLPAQKSQENNQPKNLPE